MKYFLLSCFIYMSVPLFAQGKEDHILPLGYATYWAGTNPPFGYYIVGGQLLNFSGNKPVVSLQPFPTKCPLASICSPEGKIIAFSDGCRISNGNFNFMTNGDKINLGNIHNTYCGTSTSQITSYPIYQGFQFLPAPDHPDQYYLLQGYMNSDFEITKLQYSLISMAGDTLGEVIKKDQLIFTGEHLSNYVTSVRHANGRDWWSIVPNEKNNLYHICLLTPDGIKKDHEQYIGFAPDNPMGEAGGQICFSPDGSKFIKFLPGIGIYIFDFDRCEGLLSNPVFISFIDHPSGNGGVAVSPNNRFLYVSAGDRIEQYDLRAANIAASKVIVAVWDGYEGPFGTFFGQAIAAANGKIYMITGNNHVLHVVEQPDKQGTDCDARPHGLRLLSLTEYLAPNLPHFRTGPADGSICDSLGINNQPMAEFRWYHADSSALLTVSFNDLAWGAPETWLWDFGDGSTSQDTSATHTFAAPGTYQVCQIVSNLYGTDTLCREVNISLPVNAAVTPPDAGYYAEILPNPVRGVGYIRTSESGSFPQRVVLYDQLGRRVLEKQWVGETTALDLTHLASGVYYWKVFLGDRERYTGKVLKGY